MTRNPHPRTDGQADLKQSSCEVYLSMSMGKIKIYLTKRKMDLKKFITVIQ